MDGKGVERDGEERSRRRKRKEEKKGKKHKKFIKPGESREMAQRRAKQLQAIAKQTNDMIMQVLEDLGIEATQSADGRIQLADGRVVGQRPPSDVGSMAEGDEDKSVMSKSVATIEENGEGGGDAGVAGGGDSRSSGMSREVRRKLREMEKERNALRKKLMELKSNQERNSRHLENEKKAEQKAARLELEEHKKAGARLKKELEAAKSAATKRTIFRNVLFSGYLH